MAADQSSLFGTLLRRLIRRLVRFYYPVIRVTNAERLPREGSTLYIANHPNSLIDPVLIGITTNRPVRFMAKAPLFKGRVLGALLRSVGMIPAYRASDDKSSVRRNVESLSVAAECLARGLPMGIFPEGKSHDLTHVEQVKTGAARIAQQAVELAGGQSVWVVPLGINYEEKPRFRSRVWVAVGETVDATAWFAEHAGNEKQAMRQLTLVLDERLKAVVVHLDDARWEPLLDDLEWLAPVYASTDKVRAVSRVQRRKNIAEAINYFESKDPEKAEAVTIRVAAHHETLGQAGLRINSPVFQHIGMALLWRMTLKFWRVLFGVPALVGTLLHLIPFALVRLIAPRFEGIGKTTTSLYRILLGLPFYGAWYVAAWLALHHYTDAIVATISVVAMPLIGIFAFHYWINAGVVWRSLCEESKLLFNARLLAALRAENQAVKTKIAELGEEYREVFPDKFTAQ
ncbi:MAG: 1-acyl-sn-glycerol-3-phosphate acyltransferase [Verrucomicrobiota bacterium]|jgi:1-acyl-sn-glycerol-3-phosphate acyltransferase|nr:1-acyl-sn-glycerol-3-phosphate acyltransferase [Verrucomicrobiota bacterium]MDP7051053.1 1-acyl-sn-glycerol-3-phosphate acyltransferase [Verrucomicrobiota bacterium]